MLAFKAIRDGVIARLAAQWQIAVDALAVSFSLDASEVSKIREIDWGGLIPGRNQVFQAAVSLEDAALITSVTWPAATLSIAGIESPSDSAESILFREVQGNPVVRLDIGYRFLGVAVPKAEETMDLLCAALNRVLADMAWASNVGGWYWNGVIRFDRSPLILDENDWLQVATVEMTFRMEE